MKVYLVAQDGLPRSCYKVPVEDAGSGERVIRCESLVDAGAQLGVPCPESWYGLSVCRVDVHGSSHWPHAGETLRLDNIVAGTVVDLYEWIPHER